MKNWFSKLGENFKRTSSNIKKAIASKKLDSNTLEKLDFKNNIEYVDKRNNYFEELIHLVKSRFIGIDSLMAVMSHKNLNNDNNPNQKERN